MATWVLPEVRINISDDAPWACFALTNYSTSETTSDDTGEGTVETTISEPMHFE